MLRSIKTAALCGTLFLAALAQSGGAMAAEHSWVIVNSNGDVAIQQVYIANAGETGAWQPVAMNYAIAPGTESTFTTSGQNCLYDVKVRFSDGAEQVLDDVNVCRGPRLIAS